MKLSADKNGNTRYFTAKLGWKEQFDSREIEILYSHAVPALIPPIAVQGRKNNVMRYDISPYTTVKYYLTFSLSCEQFSELILSCINIFQHMQQVYLNFKNLVLDLDKVYIQLGDKSLHLIYLPLMNSNREASYQEFFARMISFTSRGTHELSQLLDECTMWLQRPTAFILDEFAAFIRQHMYYSAPSLKPSVGFPNPKTPVSDHFYHPIPAEDGSQAQQDRDISSDSSTSQDGKAVLFGASESTLSGIRAFLIREQTGERIPLTAFPFLIGTEISSVAYCVSGNAAVSRRHAQVTYLDDQFYITDLNSTNRTYVNDRALLPSMPQVIVSGAQIRLANEVFTFILEDV